MDYSKDIKERKSCIKTLLEKLHTHQDFCANEKIILSIDNIKEPVEFKLYKGKTLYINGKDALDCPYILLKSISENCPITSFVSTYNKKLEECIKRCFIDNNKIIYKYKNIFTEDHSDKSYIDYSIVYECPIRQYVIIRDVISAMNTVKIKFNKFSLIGNNWDNIIIKFDDKDYYLPMSKTFMRDYTPAMFMTPDEFNKFIETSIKDSLFDFARNATNNMNEIIKSIEHETMV